MCDGANYVKSTYTRHEEVFVKLLLIENALFHDFSYLVNKARLEQRELVEKFLIISIKDEYRKSDGGKNKRLACAEDEISQDD